MAKCSGKQIPPENPERENIRVGQPRFAPIHPTIGGNEHATVVGRFEEARVAGSKSRRVQNAGIHLCPACAAIGRAKDSGPGCSIEIRSNDGNIEDVGVRQAGIHLRPAFAAVGCPKYTRTSRGK